MSSDIAIVGIAVKAPGAQDVAGYWDVIRTGRSLSRPFPAERRAAVEEFVRYTRETATEPVLDPDVEFYDGYFLDSVDEFDYAFFGMNPKQASAMEPHQRLALRTMYLALEHAGYGGQRVRGSRTGVFVGYASNPGSTYLEYLLRIDPSLAQVALTGNVPTMMANRLSHFLDLRGPSVVVDSACSASLVAVHQAKNALLLGDCDLAVVGGARIAFAPVRHPHATIGIEAPDGVTRTFDASADGTGLGEGSGAVVLKRLDEAVSDGDRIYAVIKGSAVNHDGNTDGITNPDADSQAALMLAAWRDAGIDPRTITYIEAHGTGTRVGDPIEFEAIRRAFSRHTSDTGFCAIGTVKANIGHLFECSGVVGLIKAVLMLHHRVIPPQVNFTTPNPKLDLETGPAFIPTTPRAWIVDRHPRRCGVSAFGLGGTNAHVILEEYVQPEINRTVPEGPFLFTLSAATKKSLTRIVDQYLRLIDQGRLLDDALADICFTTNVSRSGHRHRLALIVHSVSDLRRQLTDGPEQFPEHELAEVAQAYLSGEEPDWSRLYEGQSRTIVDLPGYVFDESRSFIGFPADWRFRISLEGAPVEQHPVTHGIEFQPTSPALPSDTPVKALVLVGAGTRAEDLIAGLGLAEVNFARFDEPGRDGKAWSSGDPASYERVAQIVVEGGYTHVVHALAFEEEAAQEIGELDRRLRKNLYGLFLLSKALMAAGAKTSLVVVTHEALAVQQGARPVVVENASLVGFGKVITREYPYIRAKHVDIDREVPASLLAAELQSPEYGLFVLRGRERLRETFVEVHDLAPDSAADYLKPRGTYLITGGTGALGLAVARAFADRQRDITLILLSRSGAPSPEMWPAVLAEGNDPKLVTRVRALTDLAALGARVEVRSCDVGDPDALADALADVQRTYGRVDGIVHAAGIPGRNTIMFRGLEDFEAVIRPKVHAAFVLDQLTRDDRPDFIVHFSSVAAVFPAPGQGDYAAANYYLDNLACATTGDECRVRALDWVAWKEIGMAADFGTNGDTTFKALPTAQALAVLDASLKSARTRVFAGEVHYRGELVHLLRSFDITLDPGITAKVDSAVLAAEERRQRSAARVKQAISEVQVDVTGRPDGQYTLLERQVAQCMARALGFPGIGVDDDFFDMGGDSIMAASLAGDISTYLNVQYDVADLISDRTISEIAYNIESMIDSMSVLEA
ncbi:SDR family NAD(P)-dependent oxidoreductase [Microbispora sp. NPDC046933]|uniref:SDR family NAD(P)-dependent oxidoreductase n=1 Tax=Microbispora sp. NPDC046933 TaxID=3155618 RepID=UPI0033F917C4